MKKLTPEDPKFWIILLWYHIYNIVNEYMEDEAMHYDEPEEMMASIVTDMLDQIFPQICPQDKRWLTGTELKSVWVYEYRHPKIGEKIEQYIKEQGISRGWGAGSKQKDWD